MINIYIRIAKVCFSACGFLFLLCAQASASTLQVPSQFSTIQQAINAAQNGDTVLVAPGIYVENINFNGKAITVKSALGPQVTIIDGNQADRVVTFRTGEGISSILQGFTLKNGRVRLSEAIPAGGGVAIFGASPTISGNIIVHNTSDFDGGGIYTRVGSPTIINNIIDSNESSNNGGGILVDEGSPLIQGNTISNNKGFAGGGIYIRVAPSTQIISNSISGNQARFGGGIELFISGEVLIRSNKIYKNQASSGGGINLANSSPASIVQNLIYKNQANSGGGIEWGNPPEAVINNTIVDNDSNQGSGIYATFSVDTKFFNNIVVAQAGQVAFACNSFGGAIPTVFKSNNIFAPAGSVFGSDCQSQTGINGNISTDPLFANATTEDYHLKPGSPIDTGDNSAPQLPLTDLDGNPRILDGDHNGSSIIDMGVYEFGGIFFDLCIQDESSRDVLKINTTTGAYQLTRCRDGFTVGGTGTLSKRGCTISFQDSRSDRRILASIDTCQNKATASVQIFAQGGSLAINDRNTTNNTCACPNSN